MRTIEPSISYAALEQFHLDYEHGWGLESVGFLTRLFDHFSRLINNIKVTLARRQNSLKRSELKMLHDSQPRALDALCMKATFDPELVVPIPTGMHVTYLEAIGLFDSLYHQIDIDTTTSTLLSYFQKIAESGSIPLNDNILTMIGKTTKDQTEKMVSTAFSGGTEGQAKMNTVFHSFEDILSADHRILGYEVILQGVEKINQQLSRIEDLVEQIVTNIEKNTNAKNTTVEKHTIDMLYQIIKTAAVQFDMYGVVLAHMQMIEHNFTILLRLLLKNYR